MPYLPLARKYRPQAFDQLVGQSHVTTTLTRALETKRVAQAYLFAGSRGVGKTSAARILAKCLNCAKGPTAHPCQQCSSCLQITQGNSLDVIEIDGASNRGIDEVRTLRETVPYAPISGPFRIYIIDEVHMLTPEAFNALLKTLEEPPAHVKFIFATTAPNKVPATILSRCQRFDFRRLESTTIVQTLQQLAQKERVTVDEPALYAIARSSEGSLRDAEVTLEQLTSFVQGPIAETDVTELLGVMEADALFEWTEAILQRRSAQALPLLAAQVERGRDAAQLLVGLLRHVRNLLIISAIDAQTPDRSTLLRRLIDEPSDRLARLEEQARQSSSAELMLVFQLLAGAYDLIRRSPMPQAILELVVIRLCTREQWQSLEQISRRLEQLAGQSPSPSVPPQAVASASALPLKEGLPQLDTPMSVPMSPSANLLEMWPVFLERLGAHKMSLAAYLTEAKPIQHDGTRLTIGLPAFALHQEVLSVGENRRLIERLLGELLQGAVSVQYVTLPPSSDASSSSSPDVPDTPEAHAPPIVHDIVELFNATILNPPRPT